MRVIILTVLIMLTGCARLGRSGPDPYQFYHGSDQTLATGSRDINYQPLNTTSRQSLPQSVQLNGSTYVVVPNYTTGRVMSVIRTSK